LKLFSSITSGKYDLLYYAVFSLIITVFYFFTVIFSGKDKIVYIMILLPVLLVSITNVKMMVSLNIISLFINRYVSFFSISQIVLVFTVLSLLLCIKIDIDKLKNGYLLGFYVFVLSILPSYYNTTDPFMSIVASYHLISFALILTFLFYYFNSTSKIDYILNLFVILTTLVALNVIYQGLTIGGRVFGISGVMFVDYAGLAVVLCFVKFLYAEKRIFYSVCGVIITGGHLFHQTRNVWLNTLLILFTFAFFIVFKNHDKIIKRKKIIKNIILVFTGLTLIILGIIIVNPQVLNRIQAKDKTEQLTTKDLSKNIYQLGSIGSRFFIWQTAYNAIKEHPVIGIGFYNFPFASKKYNNLDKRLYKIFVEGLSPHVTYLAILTETGILGFLGFCFFVFIIIKRNLKYLKLFYQKRNSKDYQVYLLLFFLHLYILVSMFMSDAWLRCHGVVLWGFVLAMLMGMELNIYKEDCNDV